MNDNQLEWIKKDQKKAYDNAPDKNNFHTFVFTHIPFAGDDDDTHRKNDGSFVDWVNNWGDQGEYTQGPYVRASFVGHTHNNRFYYDVHWEDGDENTMDEPRDRYDPDRTRYLVDPSTLVTIWYNGHPVQENSPVYIQTFSIE